MYLFLTIVVGCAFCEWNLKKLAMQVNSANGVPWEAEVNPRFAEMTEKEFSALLGAKLEYATATENVDPPATQEPIPETFDSRQAWPMCETIGFIYDQGHCGSCWAMCSFEVIQDRFCIASNGTEHPWLSGQDITSCDRRSNDCNGYSFFH